MPFGRVGGLICWENYMPLARFHMYAQGVDLWIAPTLAIGDGWIATLQHLARENRMFVAGVNPVLHAGQIPADFPHRDRLVPPGYLKDNGPWLEEGNTVIIGPNGGILAGPVREKEETLIADLDLGAVLTNRAPPYGPGRPLQSPGYLPAPRRYLAAPCPRRARPSH